MDNRAYIIATIIVVISGIVGIYVGSQLTYQRNLENYRRERIDSLSLKLYESNAYFRKMHRNYLEIIELYSDGEIDKAKEVLKNNMEILQNMRYNDGTILTLGALHTNNNFIIAFNDYTDKATDYVLVLSEITDKAIDGESDLDFQCLEEKFDDVRAAYYNALFKLKAEIYNKKWPWN